VLLEILQDAGGMGGGDGGKGGNGRMGGGGREALQKRILWLLRKFAHSKYRERFETTLAELRAFARSEPERFAPLLGGLEEVASLAHTRFEG
jgi:hypothetical protein